MTYLRFAPDIETPEPDEQESIDGIIKGMTQESQTVEKREGHAMRASHAKSTACVIGELVIADDLPRELAQGLFARAGTYLGLITWLDACLCGWVGWALLEKPAKDLIERRLGAKAAVSRTGRRPELENRRDGNST